MSTITITAEHILTAGRVDDVAAAWPYTVNLLFGDDSHSTSLLDRMVQAEPSGNNKYLAWMARELQEFSPPASEPVYIDVQKGDRLDEVLQAMRRTLEDFEKYKAKLPKKDVYEYSYRELSDALKEPRAQKTRKEKERAAKEGAEVVYRDDDIRVLRIDNKEASCFYGRGTKWCITEEDQDYFERYTEHDGNQFYFVIENKDKVDQEALDRYVGQLKQTVDELQAAVEARVQRVEQGEEEISDWQLQVPQLREWLDENPLKEHVGRIEEAGQQRNVGKLARTIDAMRREVRDIDSVIPGSRSMPYQRKLNTALDKLTPTLPSKWALRVHEDDEEVEIYNAEDISIDASRFPYAERVAENVIDWWDGETQEEVFYVTYVDDNEPLFFAGDASDAQSIAEQDDSLSGRGYQIWSATVSNSDWQRYRDGDLRARDLEMSEEELVDTVDPDTFTAWFVFVGGGDLRRDPPTKVFDSNDGVNEDDVEEWLRENNELVTREGVDVYKAEVAWAAKTDDEDLDNWGMHAMEFDKVETVSAADRTMLNIVEGEDGWTLYRFDGESVTELARFRTLEEAYDHAGRYRQQHNIEELRLNNQVVEPRNVPEPETDQIPLFSQDNLIDAIHGPQPPMRSQQGPRPGDIVITKDDVKKTPEGVVTDDSTYVTTYGPQRSEPRPGRLEEAKQLRVEMGRPNAPIWKEQSDGSFEKAAIAPAIMATARWLLANPHKVMALVKGTRAAYKLAKKFAEGEASWDDAFDLLRLVPDLPSKTRTAQAGEIYQSPDQQAAEELNQHVVDPNIVDWVQEGLESPAEQAKNPTQQRGASRMKYIDALQQPGELQVSEVKPGDSVRFTSAIEKPGWPRVDAGAVGTVTGVFDGRGSLGVEVQGCMEHEGGGVEVGMHEMEVPVDHLAVLLHDEDPRA